MPLEYGAGCLKILIIMKTVIIKITLIYIQINNNNKATTTLKHFKAVKCKEHRERNRLIGKVLLNKDRILVMQVLGFLQETFFPKCDYVIANSSDIFSAVAYMVIHYF